MHTKTKKKELEELIELQPFYHNLRNEIIKPKNVIVETKYFWDNWKPKLGPTLTVIIMELRRRCYYNSETGEKRNYCWPSLQTIADSCGVSISTVKRELKRSEAKLFVRVEPRYRYDKELNKKIRTSNIYYVAMDDPLLPEDKEDLEGKLKEIIDMEKKQSESDSAPKDQIDLQGQMQSRSTSSNNSNEGRDSPKDQIDPHIICRSNWTGKTYHVEDIHESIYRAPTEKTEDLFLDEDTKTKLSLLEKLTKYGYQYEESVAISKLREWEEEFTPLGVDIEEELKMIDNALIDKPEITPKKNWHNFLRNWFKRAGKYLAQGEDRYEEKISYRSKGNGSKTHSSNEDEWSIEFGRL